MIGKLSSCLRPEAQQHYVDALYDNPSRILVHNDPSEEPKTTTNTPANSEMHFLTLSQPRRNCIIFKSICTEVDSSSS